MLQFDGEHVSIVYDADAFGESKVRTAALFEIADISFQKASAEPGFVKLRRTGPVPEGGQPEFGLRFSAEQEAGIREVGRELEAAWRSMRAPEPIEDGEPRSWLTVFLHNDKPVAQRWWVWLLGLFGLAAIGQIVDPEAGERRIQRQMAREQAERDEEQAEVAEAEAVEAEERRKGFHCLSAWDGSNRDFVRKAERMMRNPDSFEHIETRITPNNGGEHGAWMTFRAENGFGGMNVERLYARIDHETCEATILPDGPGSG